jgi:hypothetical protein
VELHLYRKTSNDKRTLGELTVNGAMECFTLEDAIREKKVYAQTCIAPGRYRVILSYSNRFKQLMPEVLNVPEFTGIRIHSGNTEHDTEGCILVGEKQSPTAVLNSRLAYRALLAKLKKVAATEKIYLTIHNPGTPVAT